MDDLISRKAISNDVCDACNKQFSDEPCEPAECPILQAISVAPAVDAEPVRHGYWIDCTVWHGMLGEIRTKCSVCGTVYSYNPKSRGDGKGGKFCEECGAKMDLEPDA